MGTPEQSIIATLIAGPMVTLSLLDYLSYREGGRTLVGMIRSRFSSGK
ncbi:MULTISPECIES: hypothetical protein [unclassified Haloferax]|jgi:hypothetical protein|nr:MULTISPECIES: hypothetical protein [unclassified Haloferax]MDS0243082.1 hypothetical protein [Haloferax sp. S2CR25]MDS0446203.1 hypothetical protein [Haloferax sp. S2CR25-2]